METFDRNQSPHLPENGAGSWIQCWDAEDCSLTELNMEASSELNSLVEDKEIAAKAVALVVNSTRKGIVALCADVATLLRAKYKLEQKLHRLCPEDSILHGAGSGSIPRSTSESSALCYEERKKTHTKQRRSASNIPRLSTGCHDDRDDHYDDDDSHHATADMMHGCVPEAKRTTQADFTKPHRQKCTHPHRVSREVQCTLDVKSESELQLQDSLKRNAELVKELGSARKEIEQLGAKLRKLQMEHLAMRYHMYDDKAVVENQQSSAGPQHDVQSDCPVIITPPLTDCKCDDCLYLTEQSRQSFQVTLKTVGVKIGDRVLLSGLRMGQVMYLGHIDGAKDKHSLFIGLQLDAPVGCHDGILEGKRYFSCEKNCGMFVPFHKVIRIIKQEEELPPVTDEVTISTQSSCLQSELSHNESCRRLQQGRRNKGSSKAWTKFSKSCQEGRAEDDDLPDEHSILCHHRSKSRDTECMHQKASVTTVTIEHTETSAGFHEHYTIEQMETPGGQDEISDLCSQVQPTTSYLSKSQHNLLTQSLPEHLDRVSVDSSDKPTALRQAHCLSRALAYSSRSSLFESHWTPRRFRTKQF